jgi:hypothetical protein
MRNLDTIPVGSFLTPEESAAMVAASTLTGKDRYQVYEVTGGYQVWDHEDAEALANRDGETVFTRWEDAHDLAAEYIG